MTPPEPGHGDDRWAAVARRDPRADGRFVYSVRTTGVYSRPTCTARPARRENVVFFDTAAQAAAAGYRPCRQCSPDRPARLTQNLDLVVRACRIIDRDHAAAPCLDDLAAAVGLSPYHFHRLFKKLVGITPHAYLVSSRARRVRAELPRAATITEAIYNAGFNSNGRFYSSAADILGMTPTRFRAGGDGEVVRYGVGRSAACVLLVAVASKGVCDVVTAPGREVAVARLHDTFPRAEIVPADDLLGDRVRQVAESVGTVAALPEDIRGTVQDFLARDAFRNVVTLSRTTQAEPGAVGGRRKHVG